MAGLPLRDGLVSGSCSSSPTFASGFLQTLPHDSALAFNSQFPPSGPAENLHLLEVRHAWHTKNAPGSGEPGA